MKIVEKRKLHTKFDAIDPGTVFKFCEDYYIKTNSDAAVCLADGMVITSAQECVVEVIECHLVID